jgi:hypothetical protein
MIRRSALLALVAALSSAAAPGAANAARTNDLAKPVLFVTGPEVSGDACQAMVPIRAAIQKYTPTIAGVKQRFTGSFQVLSINPKGAECTRNEATTVRSASFADAAMATARHIEMMNAASGPIDVVAAGSGGLVVRYALLMSARARAGQTAFGSAVFPKSLAVEDAIAIGAPMDGNPAPGSSCGSGQYCDDLKKDADHPAVHWQLLTSEAAGGMAPQGVGGTDWSVIALGGDRFAPASSATAMSPSHRTIYTEESLSLAKGLADSSDKRDMKLRYAHGEDAEYTLTNKGAHVAQRVAQDVVFGTSTDAPGEGPAYAPGCTGLAEDEQGETIVQDPAFPAFPGDKRALRVLKFGNVDAVAECFKQDAAMGAGVYRVDGPATVRINGLDYELTRSFVRFYIDTKARRVFSKGGEVKVSVPTSATSSLHLWTFADDSLKKLDWKYPADGGAIQSEDGTLFAKETKAKLFGAEVKGAISLSIGKGSTQLALSVELPGIFSSKLTGTSMVQCSDGIDNDKDDKTDTEDDACTVPWGDFEDRSQAIGVGMTLSTTNKTGLQVEKANGKVGGALRFGPFRSEGSVGVEWSRPDSEWKVEMEAKLPAVSSIGVKLKLGFKDGQLTSIYGEANSLNIPLGSSGFFLQRFGLGASGFGDETKQTELMIGLAVSFFRKIGGTTALQWDGDLTVGWGAPWKFKLEGSTSVIGEQIGSGSVEYEEGAGGKLLVKLGRVIKFNGGDLQLTPTGTITGQASNFGEFDLGNQLQFCIKGKVAWKTFEEPWCAAKAEMRITRYRGQPITQAFCMRSGVPMLGGMRVGYVAQYSYDESRPTSPWQVTFDWIVGACDVADYGAKASRLDASPTGFDIAPGQERQVIAVRGAGGQAPRVTLVAPDGRRYETPSDRMVSELPDAMILTGQGDATTFVLGRPQAGHWQIVTESGSPAVQGVRVVDVLPDPKVTARVVRGRHGGWLLQSSVVRERGQRVRFVERGGPVLHEIARSTGGQQRTAFTPAFGPGGERRIVAIVEQDGQPRMQLDVGRYIAPAPARPGRPGAVRIVRRGSTATISWGAARRATGGYEVFASLPDGRTISRLQRGRKLTVRGLHVRGAIAVSIRGLRREDEASGPVRRARR